MNMSKSVRRQLLGAGLVRAVTAAAMSPEATPEARAICASLDQLAGVATDHAMVGNRKNARGQWVLDVRAQRQRQQALHALMREIGAQYPQQLDARDFVTAALRWIEDLREQLPEDPAGRCEIWGEIAGQLQALYDEYDPDGRAYDVIDAGAARGGDFQRVTGVW